jgi:hypothetical protein
LGGVIDRLIRDCLNPSWAQRRRSLPVILLLGTRGSGKTQRLHDIEERYAGGKPWVRLDLSAQKVRPHEVAKQLAEGLSAPVKRLGRLRFPRLALGLVVIRSDVDPPDRDQARIDLRKRLNRVTADEIMRSSLEGVPAPSWIKVVLHLTARLIPVMSWSVKRRRPAFRWYQQELRGRDPDPLNALIDLKLWETKKAYTKVDEVLCAAFLADLRDAYTTGLKANERTRNCLALIDNADSLAGQTFFEMLVTVRHRHAKNTGEDYDPLVIVGTRHTRFPGLDPRRAHGTDEAMYADWADKRDGNPNSRLYQLTLHDLDVDELDLLADRWPEATAVDQVVLKLRRLTYGHLWGSNIALRAIAAAVTRDGVEQVDLRGILDWPDPDDPDRTLADGVIRHLLPPHLREDLVTCAAACDIESPSRWQALGRRAGTLDEFCSTNLWVGVQGGEDGPLALHPFLRRVLLHMLAGRNENHPNRWRAVHSRLRDYYADHDVSQALSHTLALGELAPVAAHLDERFAAVDKTSWLKELHAMVAAPRRAGPTAATPFEVCESLTKGVADGDAVPARLVAAMWISTDPIGDPDRTLDVVIAYDLEQLARCAGRDAFVLVREANRYRMRGQEGC